MNLAIWSIRNPIPAILLFAILSLAGLWGFHKLPMQAFPDIDFPEVIITLIQPGAAPAQLETEIARKVENSVSTLRGLRHTRTTITDGRVQISLQFLLETRLSDALIAAKNAVDSLRSELPPDLQQPTVSASTTNPNPLQTYAIASPRMDEEALSWFIDDTIAKIVLAVPGVGRFDRVGGVQREIRVEVDPARLAALGLTAADVSSALKNMEQNSSGGRSQLGHVEQSVRTAAAVRTVAELATFPIVLANGRHVRLDEMASIHDAVAERSRAALLNGQQVVGFKIFSSKGYDETRIAADVKQALDGLMADRSLTATLVADSVAYTKEQYDGSMNMLYEGSILAILVVGLFLRDWRATLVSASALPLSILPAFAAMYLFGFGLNLVTLLALAVIVGVLVDDAIVEIENIERHSRLGKSVRLAAEHAVTEIALAVIATSMTLVAVFLPTAFMSGVSGLVFRQFGWTAVVAVLASLLSARVITPVMAVYLLKSNPQKAVDGRLMRFYLHTVRWCLTYRKTTLALVTVFLAGSLAATPLIPTGLIPASDRGYTNVNIELPPGSALHDTLVVAENARLALKDIAGVQSLFTTVGEAQQQAGSPGQSQAGDVRNGSLALTLVPRNARSSQTAVENAIRRALLDVPGARFTVGSGVGPGERLSLVLASDDSAALKISAQALERELRGVDGLGGISSTASLERPEIVVRPDLQRASELGVSTAAIGQTIRIATIGDFDAALAKLNLDSRQVYIRVCLPAVSRHDTSTLANLRVSARGGLVPLSSIAKLSIESGPSRIDRYDRRRYVTVSADLAGMPLGVAQAAARALPAGKSMPTNVQLINTGDAELFAELTSGFGLAILVGLLSVVCVLVLLFRDFLQPVTILSAIPLSAGGAIVGLLVSHSELDLPSMIGLVMLIGIVTKNSILLVEYANVGIRDRGLNIHDALMDACHKRARPIIMTTVAMIAGMMPIALGLGADASFRQSMAIAVIGGLLTSTALSLLVVPVVYSYVDRFEHWLKRRFAGRAPDTSGEGPPVACEEELRAVS